MMTPASPSSSVLAGRGTPVAARAALPRLGFLGVGWIGLSRMRALAANGAGSVAAVADRAPERVREAIAAAPAARAAASLDELLELDLDGIVIATPSALHADQAIRALEHGLAVFCQKPLARTAAETRRVLAAARAADRLLGVDLSYRHTAALRAVRAMVQTGAIGDVYVADLVFHNAYGPAGGWARDIGLAGGGCVIDLGIHLVDAALWVLDWPRVSSVSSQLFAAGRRLGAGDSGVCEDHALATIQLDSGAVLRLACSWDADLGRDAIIETTFYGTRGAAAMRNVNGSFYDFTAGMVSGTAAQTLAAPPDDWGGRALIEWAGRLAAGARYDHGIGAMVQVAATLDAVLGR
jgi:predicted dehydrogenase